jgi:PAS domain S-box-containing protein
MIAENGYFCQMPICRLMDRFGSETEMATTDLDQELLRRYRSLENEFRIYKAQNELLKEAKKRFYSLSNRTHDGIYNFNLSIKKYAYTNPAFIKMFGHPCKDIATTDSVMERILPADRENLKRRIEASLHDASEGDETEYRCIAQDGGVRWMHDRWVVLRDENGVPTAIEGIVRDITEMKTIISIKEYLGNLLESCIDAIVVTDDRGLITLVNKGAESLFQIKREDLLDRFIGNVLKGEDINVYELILATAPTTNVELEVRLENGAVIPLLISSAFLEDKNNRMVGTISYMRDISTRKQAEERIRMLSQQLIRTQEVEMSRIARDLHDHLAQNLYSLNIHLSTLLNQLPLAEAGQESQAKKILSTLHQIISDVRKTVFNIHPTSLETLGLPNTIRNLCKNISQLYGLEVDLKLAGIDQLRINFDVSIAIYRLIQEGLNNIVKHAEADRAEIRLVYSHPTIILRIEDWGKGFDVNHYREAAEKQGCMGIWSMKERVALLNGEMAIQSDPGFGTRISIEIPYYEI